MRYAYSLLNVLEKDIEQTDEHVRIEGVASTPTPDRYGDVVEPLGAQFKTPMPLLWQHRNSEPVGQMTFAKPKRDGIPFKAELPLVREAGKLKDRVDEAIHSLRYGLVRAVSIGFTPSWKDDDVERLDGGGYRFKVWEWLELSLVTIPANSEAVITAVKNFDREQRQLHFGRQPGASGMQQRTYSKSITITPKGRP